MRVALVYHSVGGNTKSLAEVIASKLDVEVFRMVEFDVNDLAAYDGLILGTYTWGDGDLPARVDNFLLNLKQVDTSHLVTAVFGTGETNYREFCGGVDILRDYLKDTSNLAVTLKVEQLYQDTDLPRIDKFCELFNKRLKERP